MLSRRKYPSNMSGEGLNLNSANAARMYSGGHSDNESDNGSDDEAVTQKDLLNGVSTFRSE